MLLSKNSKRIISRFLIFSFCFIIFGCDYVKNEQKEETSLKGEKITADFLKKQPGITSKSECCSQKGNTSVEVYEVNANTPKAEEIKNRILSDLRKFRNQDSDTKTSSVNDPTEVPDPDMINSIIWEDTNTGKEVLVTPLNNGSETINQLSFAKYNSESNTISSQMLFYKGETNLTASELHELETNPEYELPNGTSLQFEIKDQNGNLLYNNSITNDTQGNNSKKENYIQKQEQTLGCMSYCLNDELETMLLGQRIICMLAARACAINLLVKCALWCAFLP